MRRNVLITGAARRLGACIATTLHKSGWNVIIHFQHSSDEAKKLIDALNATRPQSAHTIQADLSDASAVSRVAEETLRHFGQLNALINNASSFYPTPIETITAAQWNHLMNSNAMAPLFLSQALKPALRTRQGSIINMIDIHGERPLRDHSVYCMSKAALAMMTKALAKELAPDICVNGIAPGAILLPEGETSGSELEQALLKQIPMQRLGEPQEIADLVRLLLDAPRYLTGQIIALDGGKSV